MGGVRVLVVYSSRHERNAASFRWKSYNILCNAILGRVACRLVLWGSTE
jgi:hypothetical protein